MKTTDEGLLLSEKLLAMKLTLLERYYLSSYMQKKLDEYIKECKQLEELKK